MSRDTRVKLATTMAQAARLLLDVLSLLFENIRNMTFQLALLPDRHVFDYD